MKFILLAGLSILCFLSHAQSPSDVDSLATLLRKMPADTNKVNSLISAAQETENTNTRKAIAYGKEALELSLQIKYVSGVTKSLNCIGRGFKSSGDFDSSLYYFRESLFAAISENNTHCISSTLMNIGTVFKNKGSYDSATIYYHRALEIAEKTNDSEISASGLNNLGNILREQGSLDEAIKSYSQALEIRKQQKNKRGIANTTLNLGICYGLRGEYKTSETFFRDALEIYSVLHDKSGMAKCENNLAQSLISQDRPKEAIPFLNEALQLQRDLQDENGVASTLYSLAFANKSLAHLDESKKLSTQSLLVATGSGNKQLQLDNYKLLQEISISEGNFKQAYNFLVRADSLKESLFNESKTRIINELQTKYETEKKEQQIQILHHENRTKDLQRNILLAGSGGLLVILVAIIFIFFQQQRIAKQRVQIQNQKIEDLLHEEEINTYNAMMAGQEEERKRIAVDLHDRLGSMLSTVRAYFSAVKTTSQEPLKMELHEKATSLLDVTFDELRKIANDLSTGIISNLGLCPAIEELCETIESGSGIHCKVQAYNLNERIDNQTEIGIYRISQELLSNVLKHANAKNITVQLNKVEESLQVTIEDDGVGYDYQEKIKSPGMGLKNILVRVEKLGAKFHVDSVRGQGSFSYLEVPLRLDEINTLKQT